MLQAKLKANELYSLEQYSKLRPEFRAKVMEHKKARSVQIGPHATWIFEDRTTIQYQVQEMLRTERIFEEEGIRDELDAYNPLIPDGGNWKATFMLEFPDPQQRKQALTQLIGIEDRCWVQVEGCARVYAVADEDMPRENQEKTSSVHFLRFELAPPMAAAAKAGKTISAGVDHDHYRHALSPVADAVRASLAGDLA